MSKIIEKLDAISRTRALTMGESLLLEREILIEQGKTLPYRLNRALARHGIRRRNREKRGAS